ncbi:fibulin-2 isoform X2 [Arapaima gigas]
MLWGVVPPLVPFPAPGVLAGGGVTITARAPGLQVQVLLLLRGEAEQRLQTLRFPKVVEINEVNGKHLEGIRMASGNFAVSMLVGFVLSLCIGSTLSQRDCTGVDCPLLENCIEEVLESGACCASCVQTGCTCEGYQYYDCVNAGFHNGKVPEGESYFVDFGSTECSCPEGGGRISCHFIPCPEIPPNCIEFSHPADGCSQCKRIGCIYQEHKYEAGHTFHMDPCQVCHCPNDGGNLMCYPIPDCDPQQVQKPMLATEDNTAKKPYNRPHILDRDGVEDRSTTSYRMIHSGHLTLFKQTANEGREEEEEEEVDYDYSRMDTSKTPTEQFSFPTEAAVTNPESSSLHERLDEASKHELKETFESQEVEMEEEQGTDIPQMLDETTATLQKTTVEQEVDEESQTYRDPAFMKNGRINEEKLVILKDVPDPSVSEKGLSYVVYHDHMTPSGAMKTIGPQTTEPDTPLEADHKPNATHSDHTTQMDNTFSKKDESHAVTSKPENAFDSHVMAVLKSSFNTGETPVIHEHVKTHSRHVEDGGVVSGSNGKHLVDHSTPSETTEHNIVSKMKFNPTSEPPSRVKVDEEESAKIQQQTWSLQTKEEDGPNSVDLPEQQEDIAAKDLVEMCCNAGHRWASDHRHCNDMRLVGTDSHAVCRISQEQCCSAFLKESSCLAGMNAAKAGDLCDVDGDACGTNSYQARHECCSCCSLGLHFKSTGQGCEAHQHLGYPCGHVFLTCCEEEEHDPNQTPLRRKEKPEPTALPKRVSDSGFPKEAFSVLEPEAANSVEELEDVDECELYEGQLCHHQCVNTWGSYVCTCFPGYHLLPDGQLCVPDNAVEDNRVAEEAERPTTKTPMMSTTPPTQPPTLHNPCEGNGPCTQQCTVEDAQAHCSCFPGFTLMADGQTCEDVNECVTNTHSCQASERCSNTVGSFVCEKQATCQAGFQLENNVCVDVDECVTGSNICTAGFECQNTVGSFYCSPQQRCSTGFTQDAHGNCIDVDECVSVEEPCSSGFNCINTVGSYTCQRKVVLCSQGYHVTADGARCVDVDECQTGVHRCGEGQICQNLPGTYRCDCQTGYQYDMVRRMCVDVNECWRYPGRLCAQTCENSPGSYRCSCTAGFTLAYDGKNCEDVNECNNNPCSQECANIYGSYQCYCRQGFYLKEDGHTCEDIDECSQSIGHLCAFRCVNVPGSYQCTCPPHGYTMSPNGRTCRDIDECALGAHNCSATETCYNIQGSFRCLSFRCPQNYRKVSDTRCERISCPNFMDCQNLPLRITYYQLSFQTNILIPAQIFRIGPSPAYSGDNIVISITRGNEENYFSTRKLNAYTGAVYLQRQVREPRDFLIDVEMKLLRQGTFTTFLARIFVFITANSL